MSTLLGALRARPLGFAFSSLSALLLAGIAGGAGAQTPDPTGSPTPSSAAPAISLELLDQPIHYGPGDPLDLAFEVENHGTAPLDGFQLVIGVDSKVRSRSELHEEFTPSPGLAASSLPFDFDETIEAGGTTMITIHDSVDRFPTLAGAAEGGVYPATIELRSPDGLAPLDVMAIPLIYYPQEPETRLDLALVVPLNSLPQRAAGGGFTAVDDDDLVGAVSPGGWLRGLIRNLERATHEKTPSGRSRRGRKKRDPEPSPSPLHLTIAPTPRLLEELADMANGFPLGDDEISSDAESAGGAADILQRLRDLVTAEEVQTVLVPYSFPDLPTLIERLPSEHVIQQIETGRDIVTEILGIDLGGEWLFPPAGRLDASSLQRIQSLTNVDNVFLSDQAVEPAPDINAAGCPDLSPSFTCLAEVRSTSGTSRALIGDAGLSDRLSDLLLEPNDRLTLQEFFAETAMIREEAPGLGGRVVQATIPSLWHPPAHLSRTLLDGVREAPWLRPVTAQEAVQGDATVVERTMAAEAPHLKTVPSATFFDELAELDELVESYGSIVPVGSQRIVRLRRNVLTAASRSWWRHPEIASDYLSRTSNEIEGELDKISLSGPSAFTFTSRDGELQFVVVNETEYAVRLRLTLSSSNFTLDDNSFVRIFEPGRPLVEVEATARTSGTFPLEVTLETPDGYPIAETSIPIRSTSLNKIALGITVGALLFLILFYVLRAVRKRSRNDEVAGSTV